VGTLLQILIADDHALLRKGLYDLIGTHPDWSVCGEAADGRDAVLLAERLRPDLVVVDLLMPELNGIEATRRIREASPRTSVLVLAGSYSERLEQEAREAGARGFVLKSSVEDRVVAAIEAVARGETAFVCEAARGGEPIALHGTRHRDHGPELTSREIEIAQLLAEGKTNWCIATILGISVRTVETHRSNLMRKLGLQSVVELVHYAVRNLMVETLPPASNVTPASSAGGER
jgi:DNA-binding NarL/FixJ family response regulator